MGVVALYRLIDPRNDSIFYIGISKQPKRRLWDHAAPSRAKNKPVSVYIQDMRKEGHYPILDVIGWHEESRIGTIEGRTILWYIQNGHRLFNLWPTNRDGRCSNPIKEPA